MVHTKGLATDSRAEFTFFIQTPVKGVKTLKKCLLLSKIPHFKQETNPKLTYVFDLGFFWRAGSRCV